jgi:cholesterol transport system auxiliary component
MIAVSNGRALLLATTVALGACGLSRPSVETVAYYLSVTRERAAVSASQPVSIRVRPLRAVPLYDRKEFVYRIDGERVVSDFYNEFAETPDAMITAAVTEWLKGSRMFKAVIDPRVPVDTPYALDGTIIALFGDFRDPSKPTAVLGIQFYVLQATSNGREIIFDRVLEERVELSARTAHALVQGYNDALRRILSALERELAALDLGRAAVTQR